MAKPAASASAPNANVDANVASPSVVEALRVAAAAAEAKRAKRCQEFNMNHTRKFGLEVAARDDATGAVTSVVCLFCKHFGREEKANHKRKATTNFKYFKTSFRSDQYLQHVQSQHPRNWERYQAVSDHEKRLFFPVSTISNSDNNGGDFSPSRYAGAGVVSTGVAGDVNADDEKGSATKRAKHSSGVGVIATPSSALVEDERTRWFEVKKAVVDMVCGNSTESSPLWRPRGLRSCELVKLHTNSKDATAAATTTATKPEAAQAEEDVRNVYRVSVRQRMQLDLAVDLMATGLTHRQIAKALSATVKRMDLNPSLSASEDEVADLVRLSSVVSLDAISKLLEKSWAFSVGMHTVTLSPVERSYVDIRLRVYSSGKVHDLHLVAIRLFDPQQQQNSDDATSTMYQTFERAMDAVFPPWRGYLIGLGSDGEAKMNDRVSELIARIQQEASNPVYRTWSGSNQLDVTMKQFYNSLMGGSFVSSLRTLTGYIRSQESLVLEMGHPPSVVNPNPWLAMGKDTKWITDKRVRLRKHLEEEKPAAAPEDAWWVAFFVVNWVAGRANEVFKKLQNKRLVVTQQTALLSELAADFVQTFHVQGPFNASAAGQNAARSLEMQAPNQFSFSRERQYAISKATVREFIGDLGVFVNNIVARVEPLALDIVVENLAGCLANLVESLMGMTVEFQLNNSATELLPPVLPQEVAQLSGRDFATLLERHSDHLRAFFSEEEMDVVDQEHQALRRASTKEKALKTALGECDEETSFERAWLHTAGRFRALQNFAGGLATVFPSSNSSSTASSELADLPCADGERDSSFGLSPLADFSLEGTLHAQQFHQLQTLLEESHGVVL